MTAGNRHACKTVSGIKTGFRMVLNSYIFSNQNDYIMFYLQEKSLFLINEQNLPV